MVIASDAPGTGRRSHSGRYIMIPRSWKYIKKSRPGKKEMLTFDV
jgi:hypothetical protein